MTSVDSKGSVAPVTPPPVEPAESVLSQSVPVGIDPVPAESPLSPEEVERLSAVLSDGGAPLPQRFDALFSLRSARSDDAATRVCACLLAETDVGAALLKHELAYCLGQMQRACASQTLRTVLADRTQAPMVRHEAGVQRRTYCSLGKSYFY